MRSNYRSTVDRRYTSLCVYNTWFILYIDITVYMKNSRKWYRCIHTPHLRALSGYLGKHIFPAGFASQGTAFDWPLPISKSNLSCCHSTGNSAQELDCVGTLFDKGNFGTRKMWRLFWPSFVRLCHRLQTTQEECSSWPNPNPWEICDWTIDSEASAVYLQDRVHTQSTFSLSEPDLRVCWWCGPFRSHVGDLCLTRDSGPKFYRISFDSMVPE